jgi:hypothetical protein
MKLKALLIVGAINTALSMSVSVYITTGGSGAGGDGYFTLSQDVTFSVTADSSF